MNVRFLIGSMLAAVSGPISASAQSLPTVARQFEFSVFCDAPIAGEVFYQAKPEEVVPITFKPYRRTGPYSYAGAPDLALAKSVPASVVGAPPSYELMTHVSIDPSIKRPLLVFLANAVEPKSPTIAVVEDDPDAFGRGSLVVLNYSGFLLRGFINGIAATLSHGGSARYAAATTASVQLAMSHNNKLFTSFDQKVTFESTERTVLLLLPPQRKSSPLVRWILLTDEVSPAPSETDAKR